MAMAGRAEAYRRANRYWEALADLRLALSGDPENDWYHYLRGLVLTAAGESQDATTAFEMAVTYGVGEVGRRPEDPTARFNLALYYSALQRQSEAEALYRQGLAAATPGAKREAHYDLTQLHDVVGADGVVVGRMLSLVGDSI
jgi:tetratricopeptide (TPR) repeat protein